MINLPTNILQNILILKRKYPYIFATLIIAPLLIAIYFTYSTTLKLNKNEIKINESVVNQPENIFTGRVTFKMVQDNKNMYDLYTEDGDFIASLRSDDQKLQLVEGLVVQIKGNLLKGRENMQDTIIVEEVILNSNINE